MIFESSKGCPIYIDMEKVESIERYDSKRVSLFMVSARHIVVTGELNEIVELKKKV
jgi:hypothetical protein